MDEHDLARRLPMPTLPVVHNHNAVVTSRLRNNTSETRLWRAEDKHISHVRHLADWIEVQTYYEHEDFSCRLLCDHFTQRSDVGDKLLHHDPPGRWGPFHRTPTCTWDTSCKPRTNADAHCLKWQRQIPKISISQCVQNYKISAQKIGGFLKADLILRLKTMQLQTRTIIWTFYSFTYLASN